MWATLLEPRQLYKMLRLKVTASQDESLKVSGAFGDDFSICKSDRTSPHARFS